MIYKQTYSALMSSWDGGLFAINAYYPNQTFNPIAGENYALLAFMPNQTSVATIGDNGLDELKGIMQVSLYYAIDTGLHDVLIKADEIAQYYVTGKRFVYENTELRIYAPTSTTQPIKDGNFIKVFLSVYFSVHYHRGVIS